ncbi:MAG: DUF2071 domain-containing protein [Planctomycetaceae bacterium]|jgi:uncharacterized protein|nr:DUF2071 domain-containing protein [Planctomycetaceae bacterium]MDC0274498.1 DUF2071 domain-containing protein [Planctomycetaceae bacterium]MDG2390097.1 DUF2071 domain-containing protein [Planctomycetaceae bacterium]
MNDHSLEIDRIAPTRQPDGSPIGYQSWRDLAFIHWRVPADEVQALLPDSLSVDTFDGSAWIGLVPFAMRNVRPWWSPSVPGVSNFLETNVRTYVHKDGRDPGVWFFSLEASKSLAVRLARKFWNLPYSYAEMSLTKNTHQIQYQSNRYWPDPIPARSDLTIEFDQSAEQRTFQTATPDTFVHFLVERYYLYASDSLRNPSTGILYRGQVYHEPYQYCRAELVQCHDELVKQAGFDILFSPEHVAYSPGVDVEIYPLKPVN